MKIQNKNDDLTFSIRLLNIAETFSNKAKMFSKMQWSFVKTLDYGNVLLKIFKLRH